MPFCTLPPANILGDFGEIIAGSSLFAKLIILILFVLSVVSWAVMAERARRFQRAARSNREFWERFSSQVQSQAGMDELAAWAQENEGSPLGAVFHFFRREFWPLYRNRRGETADDRLLLGVLRRGADRVATAQIQSLESGITWLATLSAVAPFLGLLGTVWGIMGSFLQIGRLGTATLDAVGPGIAEALVTTVCGLFVAIPAVVGYNWYVRRLRAQEAELVRLVGLLEDRVAAEELEAGRVEAPRVSAGGYPG
jgi:biopolymer transport protein TolQ